MSFSQQLKQKASAASSSFSVNYTRKKSLVYDDPSAVDQEKRYSDCLKAFKKLCDVDESLKKFKENLFSPDARNIQMASLTIGVKKTIDEKVQLFFYLIDQHIRSPEAPWLLEWMLYKFEVARYNTDMFIRLVLPHYESGLFVKAIQILDFNNINSNWKWLEAYAQRGTPISQKEFYRACCCQSSLIPFIATSMHFYIKFELQMGLNRISNYCKFFTYTFLGLFEMELPTDKKVKIVNALQGTLRKGLRSNISEFKNAALCVVLKIACSLTLNQELVNDWIGCILKTSHSSNPWQDVKSVRHLMKSQGIPILSDELRSAYENVLNELSPLERAMIEREEEESMINSDVSTLASSALEQSERVQKATIVMDVDMAEPGNVVLEETGEQTVKVKKHQKKLTVKRVLKMSTEKLFSQDPQMNEQFEIAHATLGKLGVCVLEKPECECTSRKDKSELSENWLADFLIATLVPFTQTMVFVPELHLEDVQATLVLRQCQSALQILKITLDRSNGGADTVLVKALNKAFLCVLSALVHPIGEVRVGAYETLALYLNEYRNLFASTSFNHVRAFLNDVGENSDIIADSTKSLLQGDSLSALVQTTKDLVHPVFRLFCRHPLKDDAYSQMCWFSASQLLQDDLLKVVVELGSPSSGNGSKCGWYAVLQLFKRPPFPRFEVSHQLCLSKLDAFTLPTLASLYSNTSNCTQDEITLYETEILNALLETSEAQLSASLPKLLLRAEHYTYLLEKLDPGLNRPAKSLSARLASKNKNVDASFSVKRISTLQVILTSLVANMQRLQTASVTESPQTLQRTGSSSSLLSLVGDSITVKGKRRPSKAGKVLLNGNFDPAVKDSDEGSSRKDLVHPLNSHLLACIHTLKTSACKAPRRITGDFMSTDSESDEGVVEDTAMVDVNLQEQASFCMLEVLLALTKLFEVGNAIKLAEKSKSSRKSPLMPSCSVKAVMENIFGYLNVFESSANIQRQAVLCLVEMASLFPVLLCEQLLNLIKWIGGTDQGHSIFLKIDNVHNLHLMDRLIGTAIPALLKVSNNRAEGGLKVLEIFVRGLPDLPTNCPRRCVTLYAALVRGLADVTAPSPLTGTSTMNKKTSKQFALSGWLWTAALAFFNTNFPSKETADFVFPLLTDLFNQFELNYQLGAWQQCFKFFLQIILDSERNDQQNKSKRPRMEITLGDSNECDFSYIRNHLSKSDIKKSVHSMTMGSRKRSRPDDERSLSSGNDIRTWPLLANVSAFLTNLLETPGHHIRQQNAVKDSLENIQDFFEEIIQLTLQLLITSTASSGELENSNADDESTITSKDATANLQSLLVQMNSLMSSQTFLRAVSQLMSYNQANLTRKALELLLAKLECLTAKCPNAAQLLLGQATKSLPQLDKELKNGLLNILIGITSSFDNFSPVGTDKNAALRLSCLQKLTQLLCKAYPERMVHKLDNILALPEPCLWLANDDSSSKSVKLATEAAEVRSMACLFAFECLARLPLPYVSLNTTSTVLVSSGSAVDRIRKAIRFGLDQASTACGFTDRPVCSSYSIAGTFNSREQHLQSGVTLVLAALELGTKGIVGGRNEFVLQKLNEKLKPWKSTEASKMTLCEFLFTFIFRTTNANLAEATKAKAERSSPSLKQSAALINRLRNHLIGMQDSRFILQLSCALMKQADPVKDWDLLTGGLEFISRHADRRYAQSKMDNVDLDAGEDIDSAFDIIHKSQPLIIWDVMRLALDGHPVISTNDSTPSIGKAACMACSSLIASTNLNNRVQLVEHCLRWLVSDEPDTSVLLTRLESFFAVIHRLASKLPVTSFLNLIKEINLPNLFVCILSLISGEHKSKNVKKMAEQLELSYLNSCFANGVPKVSLSNAGSCAKATFAAVTAWLQAESASSTCLDIAGTEAVLALPSIIVQPLSAFNLGLTEIDLVPCVHAFLKAIGGDEALLRPFGSSLCTLLRNTHWQIRLGGIHLLRQTFEILTEGDNKDLGLLGCLQSEMYAALSEAMEDKKPEVEAAANRLFSDLEKAGIFKE